MIVYSAPEDIVKPDVGAFFGSGKPGMAAYQDAERAYIDAVSAWARQNGQPHRLAGEYVQTPYADSYAQYVVGKFGGKVGLIHLDIMDGWRDGQFERLCTVAELTRMVNQRHARAEFDQARFGTTT